MITTSIGPTAIKKNAASSRLTTLPYYADVPGAPQNTVIGGASCG